MKMQVTYAKILGMMLLHFLSMMAILMTMIMIILKICPLIAGWSMWVAIMAGLVISGAGLWAAGQVLKPGYIKFVMMFSKVFRKPFGVRWRDIKKTELARL